MEPRSASDPTPALRRARGGDAHAIRELVVAAYAPYVPLLGRTPIPMLTDHAAAIRDHDVWVLEAEEEARRRELPEIRMLTNERYVANIAMYTRYGYRETHRRPHLGTDLVHFTKAPGS